MDQIFQRISSVLIYTLPLKASIPFGYYLFYKYSFLKILMDSLTFPIAKIEESLPFGGFLLFILLFAGIVRNPKVPYFVRYNSCQALLIDIALIIITYLFRILPIVELGSIISILSSIIFIFSICIFIYSISQCIYGIEPEIPLISKSVRMQI
ncbi:Tic20 family protein [Prochlorococcus marinus]|uniref:Tic20 family protein n=1 Tax=Prochlorococcus marinus TaxID=1219 RepID=UPI001ADCFD4E|nr:Tic20 family protein [Prochlorococcus marinus]MBO8204234.1 hypothetical protein [Prochlorococcus marinus CUG1415]MBW3043535.1 hypothetical protein [Prochlorococcus marinus str. MU1415]